MTGKLLYLIFFLAASPCFIFAQKKESVLSSAAIEPGGSTSAARACKDFRPGRALLLPEPKFPSEARQAKIGGTVEVTVEIDENGAVLEIKKITGNKILQGSATLAANKAKFVPALCDGVKTRVSGVITYKFMSGELLDYYVSNQRIEEFADVKTDSQFYPSILDLTENYRLAFGYADGNFHPEMPLTRGDFVHFLRLTLDMLASRAKFANLDLRKRQIIFAYNPQKIPAIGKIKELKSKEPFFDSARVLLENYDIALVTPNQEFFGKSPMTLNDVIDVWKEVFGEDAVPVNFQKTQNFERILSRGEFALFLQESLSVLTYKLLP